MFIPTHTIYNVKQRSFLFYEEKREGEKNVKFFYSLSRFSSRGFAPPKIVDDCDVSASAFTGAVTVLGFSCNLGLPDVSEKKITL